MSKVTSVKDIAELAGVSPMTVSRVFSGKQKVAAGTRQKVLACAEAHGYQPNFLARSLRDGKTWMVAVSWSLAGPHGVGDLIRDLTLRMRQRHYSAQVFDHVGMTRYLHQALDDCLKRRVDGFILHWATAMDQELIDKINSLPAAVLVTRHDVTVPESLQVDVVRHNTEAAMASLARHLTGQGRTRVAYLLHLKSNRYKAAQVQAHLPGSPPLTDSLIFDVTHRDGRGRTPEVAREVLAEALADREPWFDALVCGSDEIALGALSCCRDLGLRVPDDLALVGFNNSSICSCLSPPLASIERCERAVTQLAWECLYQRMEQPAGPQRQETVDMEFVWRESAGGVSP